MRHEDIKKRLCSTFCGSIDVRAVPSGLAISSIFTDSSGDPIEFYLTSTGDGFRIEDDGSYLASLAARDIPIMQGQRLQLLDSILAEGGVFWDQDTLEIKTPDFQEGEISRRVVDFMSSLIRVRDLELLTREVVKSTFREDATSALELAFEGRASFAQDVPVSAEFAEFPADLVIRPKDANVEPTALYFVTNNDRLNEALLLQQEAMALGRSDLKVIALIEDPEMKQISRRRFQRAQNRSLAMPIFRGDEVAAIQSIGRRAGIAA